MPSRDYLSTPPPLSGHQNGSELQNANEAPLTPATPKRPEKKSSLYKTELCRSWEETGQCRYGNKCQFAHSGNELRLIDRHPKYKTEMCKTFWDRGTCPYGKRCCFIHNEKDKILEYQMAQKKLAEEAGNEVEQQDLNPHATPLASNGESPETSPALSVASEVRPVRRKTTLEGSSFPFLLESGSPMENGNISGIESSPVYSRRSTILPPGIPLDPIHDLSDILQETYLDSTLRDDVIFRDIINSDDHLASSPSISIPKSPNATHGRSSFLSQQFLSPPRSSHGLGFSNVISPTLGSGFSNGDIFEDNSSSAMEPFNDDIFSKSWSAHSVGQRQRRTRTFTETSAGGFASNQYLGLTNLVPLDENIGF